MDFYSRQQAARRHTRWLVLAFVIAILLVVAALDIAVLLTLGSVFGGNVPRGANSGESFAALASSNTGLIILSTIFWLLLILGASVYKGLVLRGGGGVVARSLGGTRVESSTQDPLRRRLLNVVEEMSIASSVPVPEVYVLENEAAINAFAAGDNPSNAAVAVTDGALQKLNREQLQGVIAHEFSHVLNGDMRLNLRLMGWLFGLFVIALIGRGILRLMPRRSGRKGGGLGPIIALGLAMLVLGYIGLLLGRLIQSGVSRHRERLADASAVQFTRNPEGLKAALLKIAGLPQQSRLETHDVDQVAHMLFASGLKRMFATHPSLEERILALDPRFDLRALPQRATQLLAEGPGLSEPGARPLVEAGAVMAVAPADIAAQVGNPEDNHVQHARALRRQLRPLLETARRSWPDAQAVLLASLLSRDAATRALQLREVAARLEPRMVESVAGAADVLRQLPPLLRLPALQTLFTVLRSAPESEREKLLAVLRSLMLADGSIDVFEYSLGELLATSLDDGLRARRPHGSRGLEDVADSLGTLFAVLAHHGATDAAQARRAYELGLARLLPRQRPDYRAPGSDWPTRLDTALHDVSLLQPLAKQLLVEALVIVISHDNALTVAEAELLRAVCGRLQCPMPPVLPKSRAELGAEESG
jgi:Zn-dependent protease with chaperone function